MMPGPQIVYKCPTCEHLVQQNSMASGNTFGAVLFSDGKYVAPMMSETLQFTRCRKCGSFYWYEETNELIRYNLYDKNHPLHHVESPQDLKIQDYHDVMAQKFARTYAEIIYIRQRLMWLYNDSIRYHKDPQSIQIKDYRHYENLKLLLENLFMTNPVHVKLAAEAHRNLGDFNKSIKILESIEKESFESSKMKLIQACHKQLRNVMAL